MQSIKKIVETKFPKTMEEFEKINNKITIEIYNYVLISNASKII